LYFTGKDFVELADLDYTFNEKPIIAEDIKIYGTEGCSFVSVSEYKPREYKKPESLVNNL
jgi:hypothetical protein